MFILVVKFKIPSRMFGLVVIGNQVRQVKIAFIRLLTTRVGLVMDGLVKV